MKFTHLIFLIITLLATHASHAFTDFGFPELQPVQGTLACLNDVRAPIRGVDFETAFLFDINTKGVLNNIFQAAILDQNQTYLGDQGFKLYIYKASPIVNSTIYEIETGLGPEIDQQRHILMKLDYEKKSLIFTAPAASPTDLPVTYHLPCFSVKNSQIIK